MRILNLYAGIGGNRKLWSDDHEVVSVEYDEHVAAVYADLYPQDKTVVDDAHQYLLDHFREYDFIWSSPPCPTHSKANLSLQGYGIYRYPEMSLYQEVVFLRHFFKGAWVVENVDGYYEPLIQPEANIDRHLFWASSPIAPTTFERGYNVNRATKESLALRHGIELPTWAKGKRKMLRNAVMPELGRYVFDQVAGRLPS
jgi:DNA (cytosine-5)-methyltransferase 1